MGSELLSKIPVIDFSQQNMQPGQDSWLTTSKSVMLALEQYGCFAVKYSEVSLELHNTIFSELEDLFDLPVDVKIKYTSEKPYFGYAGQQPGTLRESMGIGNATSYEDIQSFAKIMWPEGNEPFCDAVLSYTRRVSELEQMVTRMVFEIYGVEKYHESHVALTTYLLGLIKYTAPNVEETKPGCDVHTDKSFTTILHQNQVHGLEIRTKDGNWISFEPTPSSFLVLAGDALLAWSNGRIHSPVHRVMMRGSKTRYSLGLFSFHSGVIQVPQELADAEHPLQFGAFDHYGLVRYFKTQQENKEESSARAYCGL